MRKWKFIGVSVFGVADGGCTCWLHERKRKIAQPGAVDSAVVAREQVAGFAAAVTGQVLPGVAKVA